MSEIINETKEITISDIFKVIRKRGKIIVCLALVGLILGAAAGASLALISNATYGAKSEFYITSAEANGTILSLLRSDGFAEMLLLDDNGLPANKSGTEAYANALKLKGELDALKEEKEATELELERLPDLISVKQRAFSIASDEVKSIDNLLVAIYEGQGAGSELAEKYEKNKVDAKLAMSTAQNEYYALLEKSDSLEAKISELTRDISKKNTEIKIASTELLADLRKDEAHIRKVQEVKEALSFSYTETTEQSSDKSSNSRSLLLVSVAVQFDKAFAEELVNKISLTLPGFVEDSIIPEKEEDAPQCSFVSGAGTVGVVNYENPYTQAVKYGAVAMAAAVVGSCALFIFIDLFIKTPKAIEKAVKCTEKTDDADNAEETVSDNINE